MHVSIGSAPACAPDECHCLAPSWTAAFFFSRSGLMRASCFALRSSFRNARIFSFTSVTHLSVRAERALITSSLPRSAHAATFGSRALTTPAALCAALTALSTSRCPLLACSDSTYAESDAAVAAFTATSSLFLRARAALMSSAIVISLSSTISASRSRAACAESAALFIATLNMESFPN